MKVALIKVVGWMMLVAMVVLITAESYIANRSPRDNNQSILNDDLSGDGTYLKYSQFGRELSSDEISRIKRFSKYYGIDYRIILSIIKQESQFDSTAVSERGATGLMQMMPMTHAEMNEALDLDSLNVTSDNIQTGIYYFSKLYNLFSYIKGEDRLCFSLAAYNAGPSRIYDAQEIAAYMGENPNKWSVIENVLPLLSKRYYSLHQEVWGEPKPRNGYFGSWRQTVKYVQNITITYKNLSQQEQGKNN
ncbi:MAG: transglycosylase SLT domain-containing protein [Ignavibacteriales bacterium]|nr:transglycosylase SLT domain-containing protein [Ignavibacteriales bacterium]